MNPILAAPVASPINDFGMPHAHPGRGVVTTEDLGDLNEPATEADPAAIAVCLLSLTRDERLEPRLVKAPFGRDFVPFM